jgi:dTDP-glucose 4,6-dehydratase
MITRCSNNYGPYQFPEKLIPLMLKNIISGEKLPVYGEGKNIRDWIYVTDHCDAVCKVVLQGKVGEVYNIGGSCEKRNIEVVQMLIERVKELVSGNERYEKVLKTDKSNINEDLITFVKDRLGHDYRYAIDSSKVEDAVGWKPVVEFSSGMDRTIKWYLDNLAWIEDIESGRYEDMNNEYVEGKIE